MTTRKLRKEQTTAKRQDQILNAAMEIFSQKGYAAATIPDIAGKAGVATGTIYIYYPSKRELFIALLGKIGQAVSMFSIIENMPETGFPTAFKTILQKKF